MPTRTLGNPEPLVTAEPEPDDGCAFVLDQEDPAMPGRTWCGNPRRPGSAYCAAHHARCYLPNNSPAEHRKILEIEALAKAVGGRSGRPARQPTSRFLKRMDRVSRDAFHPNCSPKVPLRKIPRLVENFR